MDRGHGTKAVASSDPDLSLERPRFLPVVVPVCKKREPLCLPLYIPRTTCEIVLIRNARTMNRVSRDTSVCKNSIHVSHALVVIVTTDDLVHGIRRPFHQRCRIVKTERNQPGVSHQHEADCLRLLSLPFLFPRFSLSFSHQSLCLSRCDQSHRGIIA
jgi:hypothetical protein